MHSYIYFYYWQKILYIHLAIEFLNKLHGNDDVSLNVQKIELMKIEE